ncbi:MAG TPA: hypothetical protein DCQ47_06525 [Gammaproteobacteria bacterium]|nr:hypothetical protein [Gammaproteobacteria bacterium]
MTFRLALFGLIASSLVGVIYVITEPMIIESKEDARNKRLYSIAEPYFGEVKIGTPINKVLANDAPVSLINPLPVTPINNGKLQIGAVVPFRALDGYSGTIELLLALDTERRILGVRAIDYEETLGLGDKIDVQKTDWILQFNGLRYVDLSPTAWAVTKDGGQFDSFTGATITPRAVVGALAETLAYFETYPEIVGSGK